MHVPLTVIPLIFVVYKYNVMIKRRLLYFLAIIR